MRETQQKIDAYYGKILLRRNVSYLNPHFVIAQHNVVESMEIWIEDVTKLGIALRNIRDVEL